MEERESESPTTQGRTKGRGRIGEVDMGTRLGVNKRGT